jgi:hypothetical protein
MSRKNDLSMRDGQIPKDVHVPVDINVTFIGQVSGEKTSSTYAHVSIEAYVFLETGILPPIDVSLLGDVSKDC